MHSGISPLDAHDPSTEISRADDLLQRQLDLRRQVADEHDRSALAQAANRIHHRVAVADHLERRRPRPAAGELADGCRHVDCRSAFSVCVAPMRCASASFCVIDVDGDDVAAAFGSAAPESPARRSFPTPTTTTVSSGLGT